MAMESSHHQFQELILIFLLLQEHSRLLHSHEIIHLLETYSQCHRLPVQPVVSLTSIIFFSMRYSFLFLSFHVEKNPSMSRVPSLDFLPSRLKRSLSVTREPDNFSRPTNHQTSSRMKHDFQIIELIGKIKIFYSLIGIRYGVVRYGV